MPYIVRIGTCKENEPPTWTYEEFFELEDAKEYANYRATKCKESDLDFDISIYEITNY